MIVFAVFTHGGLLRHVQWIGSPSLRALHVLMLLECRLFFCAGITVTGTLDKKNELKNVFSMMCFFFNFAQSYTQLDVAALALAPPIREFFQIEEGNSQRQRQPSDGGDKEPWGLRGGRGRKGS